jgi:hypothetical protein
MITFGLGETTYPAGTVMRVGGKLKFHNETAYFRDCLATLEPSLTGVKVEKSGGWFGATPYWWVTATTTIPLTKSNFANIVYFYGADCTGGQWEGDLDAVQIDYAPGQQPQNQQPPVIINPGGGYQVPNYGNPPTNPNPNASGLSTTTFLLFGGVLVLMLVASGGGGRRKGLF